MKKTVLAVLAFFPLLLFSQNGVTTVSMPSGYSTNDLRFKNAIAIDNADNKWIGFKTIGLGKYDNSTWTMYDSINSPLPSMNVLSVAFGANETWAGTPNGAARLSGSTWTVFNTSNSALSHNKVNSIVVNGNDTWFATDSGLSKYDGSNWNVYWSANFPLPGNKINDIKMDASGLLWIATNNGLANFNGSNWTVFNTGNSALDTNYIRSLFADPNGDVWITTYTNRKFIYKGNMLFDALQVYPISEFIFNGFNSSNVVAGPHGHAGCFSTATPPGFYEMMNSTMPRIYISKAALAMFSAYSQNTTKMWFVGQSHSLYKDLYCFDITQYNGFGLNFGFTNDNYKNLDINEVSASIYNRGDFFREGYNNHYVVPKSGTAQTIFASAIWIGAMDSANNLHQAAVTYRQLGDDYFPGPLDTTDGSTDSTVAIQFDRVWKIRKLEVQAFQYYWSTGDVQNGNYIPGPDFLSWPGNGSGNQMHILAPYADVNNNGIYDPLTGGDYPIIKGDEMLYWIFNDNLAAHGESGGVPLKVEVHASAYAFYCPSLNSSDSVLNYTTYYNLEIFNWSGTPYHDARVGIFQDCDLGSFDDDYVGCYPSANVAYAYNGDQIDGASALPTIGTYGAHPPISSLVILDGPEAVAGDTIDNDNDGTVDEPGERNLLTGFAFFNNDFSVTGNPQYDDEYYNYCRGFWKDSTHFTFGGDAYGGNTPVNFMYSDLPYNTSGWNEASAFHTPFDRRFVASCGPFNLNPGQPQSISYAILYTRDFSAGAYDTAQVGLMLNSAAQLQNWYATNSEPSCINWAVGIPNPVSQINGFSIYPNPSNELVTIEYKPQNENANFEVLDLTGKTVLAGTVLSNGQTVINIAELSSGIYAVRIIDGNASAAMKLIRQ